MSEIELIVTSFRTALFSFYELISLIFGSGVSFRVRVNIALAVDT